MRDGWMMDILYLLYKLYCKGDCNCDILVVCDLTVMLIFVFCFSGLFIWPIKYLTPRRCMCSFLVHIEPATMAPNEGLEPSTLVVMLVFVLIWICGNSLAWQNAVVVGWFLVFSVDVYFRCRTGAWWCNLHGPQQQAEVCSIYVWY